MALHVLWGEAPTVLVGNNFKPGQVVTVYVVNCCVKLKAIGCS